MSIPFSRSMRSLKADSYRPSLAGLLVAMLLLIAWSGWFFLARITLQETGQIVSATGRGTVIAQFPVETLGRIHRGQSALLRLDAVTEDEAVPIPAIVLDVAKDTQEGQGQVEVFPLPEAAARMPLQDNLTGRVEIEVERLSPAALVVRASGQLIDTPPVSLSPRDRSD